VGLDPLVGISLLSLMERYMLKSFLNLWNFPDPYVKQMKKFYFWWAAGYLGLAVTFLVSQIHVHFLTDKLKEKTVQASI
jgi:hypothetical protein